MSTVQIISICVSVVGWLSTIIASSKILSYRIKKLEDKIDRINDIYDRLAVVEYIIGIGYTKIKKVNIERESASVE